VARAIGAAITGSVLATICGLGGVVFLVGIVGLAWMIVTMKRARTPIHNAIDLERRNQS
jgi:hypothetical protein